VPFRRHLAVLLAASLSVALAACGADPNSTASPAETTAPTPTTAAPADTTPTEQPAAPTEAPPAAAPDLPAIDVVELASGRSVSLPSLAGSGRPTVLWFWAPHCTFCRREAAELLAFTAEHGTEVDILGLGAQDSLDEAHGFVDDTATQDLTMVWDQSGQSWVHHRVTSQPTIVVLGADGQEAGRWFRDFDTDEILAAAGVT